MPDTPKDSFEKDLEAKKELLQVCQKSKNVVTCSDCEKMFECDTRKSYVKAVYESMAKGHGGGFEF